MKETILAAKKHAASPKLEQGSWALSVSFLVGYVGHICIDAFKRRVHRYKIDRLYDENIKRLDELKARYLKDSTAGREEAWKVERESSS
ncbi:hypothetical protein ISN44_As12g005220 [Arabidopsis suecica]|uniref:Uncharacterized protein n=1 Tax=Arabidopsis suecica TaxID=45249 RepID=A0A8T1YFX0_ARASU|nr:hypothetical protein ISN44_As12g005220 [Arabidopsis suecica]